MEPAAQMPPRPRPVGVAHRTDKTRVLVVEDEKDIAGLVKHTLERGGDTIVEVAASGDQALRAASEQPPDLIVLDLNLPVLGGLEVCRLLRTRPGTARSRRPLALPVITRTANRHQPGSAAKER